MLIFTLFLGFVFGAVTVIGFEIWGILFLIRKLDRKSNEDGVKIAKSGSTAREELNFSFPNKQGCVWVLEKEKIPKTSPLNEKGSRQPKRKPEILEVSPVRKFAKIKDQSLILTESDGILTEIPLLGCTVEAVSATNLSSRKWAKRYPVKVESKTSVIYHGSKLFYMYFETSCEKESWCKALRLVSCDNKEKLKWFVKSRSEYHDYLTSLNIEYPAFLKPSIGFNSEIVDRPIKIDGSTSKVRHFLKKLAKKASKSGVENRTNWSSLYGREDRKISERYTPVQESGSVGGSVKLSQTRKMPNHVSEENIVQSSSPASSNSGSRSQLPISSDTDSLVTSDEGTLCCNLLISRLFFDAKSNSELRSSIQARIQRTLSNARSPNYIGEVICTGVDPGNIPPYIHAMRVLPSDMKEMVAMEIDIEYYGGAVLDIETRLEVHELDLPESMGVDSDSTAVAGVTTDLLEGFEYFGEQLKLNEQTVQAAEQKGDGIPKMEDSKSFNKNNEQASSAVSKWKSIVNSVAKQVSQVPLSLAIRVTTLRGTLRVHIKPPPTDQLWFGFTSMPDIDFSLESSVGVRKIPSTHIALFMISRFKAAIRETMVLPNCEGVTIPFMLAEKDDWVPLKVAPFIWTNQEPTTEPTTKPEAPGSRPCQETHPQAAQKASPSPSPSTSSASRTESIQDESPELPDNHRASVNEDPSEESKTPLLENEQPPPQPPRQSIDENRDVQFPKRQHPSPPLASVSTEDHSSTMEGDDARLRRMGTGTRARMLGLRKKMGEKLEEKRRNIEEKGKHIVEKIRGPGAT